MTHENKLISANISQTTYLLVTWYTDYCNMVPVVSWFWTVNNWMKVCQVKPYFLQVLYMKELRQLIF